jgi:8-oxo-dGTP diphosphatase
MIGRMKPVKRSVAVVVRRAAGPAGGREVAAGGELAAAAADVTGEAFLVVRRPDDPADPLGGAWGLPAVTLCDGEDEHGAVVRAGRVKLGVELAPGRRIGEQTADRGGYLLRLADYEATIVSGVPGVPQPDASMTQYTACRFTADPAALRDAAARGSVCARIFLEDSGRGRLDPA